MIDEIAFNLEHEINLEPIDQQEFIGTDQIQYTANTLPDFNFRKTSLSRPAREQLARIYKSVLAGGGAASKRSGLRNLILNNIFNFDIGAYIPVSQNTHPPITRLFISDLSALPDIEPKQHKNIFLKTSFWRQLHINRLQAH